MKIDRIAPVLFGVLLLAGCRPDEESPSTPPQDLPSVVDTTAMLVGVGQMVYVPVYSHIYHQDGSREFNLTATLSIRNTDPEHPIIITAVRYYDSAGDFVRTYLERPIELLPLASRPFVMEERNKAGGVGANFIVKWQAEAEVSLPIIEGVMISTASSQGISFIAGRAPARRECRPGKPGQPSILTPCAGSSQRLRRSQMIPGPSIIPSTFPLHG